MEDWKKEYDNIKVPEEMREKLEQSINRAKKEKKRMKKITLYKTFGFHTKQMFLSRYIVLNQYFMIGIV